MDVDGFGTGCLIISLIIGLIISAIGLALNTNRVDPDTAYHKGMEDLTRGRYVSAINEFDKVQSIFVWVSKSRQAQAYIGRGRAKTALRNFDVAIKDFDKALKLNPEQEIEQQAYSYRAIAVEALKSKY